MQRVFCALLHSQPSASPARAIPARVPQPFKRPRRLPAVERPTVQPMGQGNLSDLARPATVQVTNEQIEVIPLVGPSAKWIDFAITALADHHHLWRAIPCQKKRFPAEEVATS